MVLFIIKVGCSVFVIILILTFFITEKPVLPVNYKEATWERLYEAVDAIHNSRSISSSLEELYKAVENLCSHDMSMHLYDKLKNVCEEHVKRTIDQLTGYPFQLQPLLGETVGELGLGVKGKIGVFLGGSVRTRALLVYFAWATLA